jgi:hypothetical protein
LLSPGIKQRLHEELAGENAMLGFLFKLSSAVVAASGIGMLAFVVWAIFGEDGSQYIDFLGFGLIFGLLFLSLGLAGLSGFSDKDMTHGQSGS